MLVGKHAVVTLVSAVVGRPRCGGETPLWWGDPGGDPKGPKGQLGQKRPVSF